MKAALRFAPHNSITLTANNKTGGTELVVSVSELEIEAEARIKIKVSEAGKVMHKLLEHPDVIRVEKDQRIKMPPSSIKSTAKTQALSFTPKTPHNDPGFADQVMFDSSLLHSMKITKGPARPTTLGSHNAEAINRQPAHQAGLPLNQPKLHNQTSKSPSPMPKLTKIAVFFLATSMITGCSVINSVNNARHTYQAAKTYKMAKGLADAQPVFNDASAFNVTASLMPRDEAKAEEIEKAFVQMAIDDTLATANILNLDLRYCEDNCPTDTVNIQFKEKGRDGFIEKFAMGRAIGGGLYFTQHGKILEQIPFDSAEDYAGVAQIMSNAINLRLAKTAQATTLDDYNSGRITETEMQEKTDSLANLINEKAQSTESPLMTQLKGQN